jgi:hypothetical protein
MNNINSSFELELAFFRLVAFPLIMMNSYSSMPLSDCFVFRLRRSCIECCEELLDLHARLLESTIKHYRLDV